MPAGGTMWGGGGRGLFVGREPEFSELAAGVDEAIEGQGRGFLVLGEPGIGKTRLASEVADHATAAGVLVLWGRCWEAGGAPPYWPWIEVLRGAVESRRGHPEAPDPLAAPVSGPTEADGTTADKRNAAGARFELFDGVGSYLRQLAAAQPVLVVIDDLHAADLPSLLLLEHLLGGALRRSRIAVVALSREHELLSDDEARAAGLRLRRLARTVRLSGLDRDDVATLVRQHVVDPTAAVVDAVVEVAEGNPLFIEELAALLGAGSSDRAVTLPIGIRETIRERYAALPHEVVEVMSHGAVAGREFDLALVATIGGRDQAELVSLVDHAVRAGILVARAPGRYRFTHILVRDVLYDEMPPAERSRLHAEVAAALTARHGLAIDDHLDEIAHHSVAALPVGDRGAAVEALVEAGAHAEARLAHERAVTHYQLALDLSAHDGARNGTAHCDLLLALARANERAGRTERAKIVLRSAAELARGLGDGIRFAQAALGLSERIAFQQHDETAAVLDEALRGLPDSALALRARLLAASARVLGSTGRGERMDGVAEHAVTVARSLGDPSVLAVALAARQLTLWRPDRVADRLEVAVETLALAEGTGDRERAIDAHMSRMICSLEMGDGWEFDRSLATYTRLADELRQPRYRFAAMSRAAMRHLMCGRFEAGRRLADEARRLGHACEEPDVELVHHGVLALPALDDGVHFPEVEAFFVDFSSRHTSGGSLALLTLFAVERDDLGAARRHLDSLLSGIDDLPVDMDWLLCLGGGAVAAHALGDKTAAALLYERLVPFEDRCVLIAGAVGFAGSVAHYLGLLADTLARLQVADRHFTTATEVHARVGAAPWEARTLFAYGRALVASGDTRQLVRGEALLARARVLASELSLASLEHRLARQPMAARTVPSGVAALARHGDQWLLRHGDAAYSLADSKGLQHLAVLLRRPGQEVHVLELVSGGDSGRILDGAGGPLLDAAARAAYRRRVEELQEELAEAEAWHDDERHARAQAELDAVVAELAAATGLHGRDRGAKSASDRARVSVRKAIVRALRDIAGHDPDLGRYLETTVRTGTFCSYEPDPRFPIAWDSS